MDIIPGVKLAGHEHQFIVTTENWKYAQLTITLRICTTCGLTHRLAHVNQGLDGWKWVPVDIEGIGEAAQEGA